MMAEVPCVATRVGGAFDLIARTGYIVPTECPNSLAQSIMKMINIGVNQRKLLGMQARKRIIKHYELEKMSHRYSVLYRNLFSE